MDQRRVDQIFGSNPKHILDIVDVVSLLVGRINITQRFEMLQNFQWSRYFHFRFLGSSYK